MQSQFHMPNYYYDYRKEFWRKRLSALCGEDPSIGTIGKWWEAMFGVVSAQVVASAIDSALPNGTDIVEIATSHQRLTKLQDGALCAIVDEGHKSLVEEILECVTDMLAKKPPNIKHRPRPVLAELYRFLSSPLGQVWGRGMGSDDDRTGNGARS